MYSEQVEGAILERLHACEAEKQTAEHKLETARIAVGEKEEAIAHWRFALEDYRRAHDLPMQDTYHSPVLTREYAHLTPTELAYYWASKHNGEIVVKDLAKVGSEAGVFKQYRAAASSIYSVAKRKHFTKLGPGRFKVPHQNGGKALSPSPFAVDSRLIA